MLRETWRKSSYSYVATDCVEVAQPTARTVAVRDGKRPQAGVLTFKAGCWNAFLADIRAGGQRTAKRHV